MGFTREEIAAYEAKPASTVADTVDGAFKNTESAETDTNATADASEAENTSTDSSPEESAVSQTEDTGADGGDAESADSSTATDADSDGEKQTDGSTKPRSRAQERIEDLVAERNALREYGKHLLARVEELAGGKKEEAPAKTETSAPAADAGDPAPSLEDHKFDPVAYGKAQSEWLERQVSKKVAEALSNEKKVQTEKQVRDNFTARADELKKVHKDFEVVISNPALPKLSRQAAAAAVHSEIGPNIVYHLGKNPDLAARIARMEPEQQLVAIGRLEGQIQAELKTSAKAQSTANVKTRKTTQAPPPPTPVSGGSQGTKSLLSMEDFVANERKLALAKREEKRRIRSGLSTR